MTVIHFLAMMQMVFKETIEENLIYSLSALYYLIHAEEIDHIMHRMTEVLGAFYCYYGLLFPCLI